MKPIALLINVLNRQQKLEESLKSLESELDLIDIIVVDDGSPTPITLAAFAGWPIHLIRLEVNQGVAGATNAGLEYIYAKGYEFIARLDAGDYAMPLRFARQLAFLRENPEVGLLGTQACFDTMEGKRLGITERPLEDHRIRKEMRLRNIMVHPSLCMRASAARQAGFYDLRFTRASSDYDFCMRMLKITKVANLSSAYIVMEYDDPSSISNGCYCLQVLNALRIKLLYFDGREAGAYMGVLRSLASVFFAYTCRASIRPRIKHIFNIGVPFRSGPGIKE